MRLDKLLAFTQVGSRSEVKRYIRQGCVTVDGSMEVKPERQVDPAAQKICCFGKPIQYQALVYYMFYKPKDCVTAHRDNLHKTVMDYIDVSCRGLSPVGRLDLDVEGLLLLTNDGELAHALLSPKRHIPKVYEAKINGWVKEDDIKAFREGLDIGDQTPARPAELVILQAGEISDIRVTVTEGRYHQVKRMFDAVGKPVVYLKRIAMGSLTLDPSLMPGEYRALTVQEEAALKRTGGGLCFDRSKP